MTTDFKQVGTTGKSSRPAPASEPPLSKRAQLTRIFEVQKMDIESAIHSFKRSLEAEGISHTMIHKGTQAVFAESAWEEFAFLEQSLHAHITDDDIFISSIKEELEVKQTAAIKALIGLGELAGDFGPWDVRSNNRFQVEQSLQRANAKRRAIRVFERMLKVIAE